VKRTIIALSLAAVVGVNSYVFAQDSATAPAKAPLAATAPLAASAPAPTTASAPASQPVVVATVGDVKIISDKIDGIVELIKSKRELTKDQEQMLRGKILDNLISEELAKNYIKTKKIEVTPAEIAEQKDEYTKQAAKNDMTLDQFMKAYGWTDANIADGARLKKMVKDATTKEKIAEVIKAHPEYFNGTSVKASHILILCSPVASTEEQKAAKAKIEGILADIQAKKMTFGEAAKKFSEDPGSKIADGALGEAFTFEKMVPQFAAMAWATPKGDISKPVRSEFGYHIILVTDRTDGTAKAEDMPMKDVVAEGILMGQLQSEIFGQAEGALPVVIVK